MRTLSQIKVAQYTVYPQEFSFRENDGDKVSLQPKFIEVLVFLATQYPRIVSRQELIDAVWDGNSYVGEKALTNSIWFLRKTFRARDDKEIIETIRKTGYRLLVEPSVIDYEEGAEVFSQQTSPSFSILNRTAFLGIAIITSFLIWHFLSSHATLNQANIETVTTEPGRELFVAPSPDGRFVVYKWINSNGIADLYMKDLKQPDVKPIQLTFGSATEGPSVWSNDGKYLYFSSKKISSSGSSRDYCDIIRLNVMSREELKITECPKETGYVYIDISPDDSILAYHGDHDVDANSGIYFLNLKMDGAKPIRFSCISECEHEDRDMAFSPDGKKLAVTRRNHRFSENIYIVDMNSKEEQKLTQNEEDIVGLTWHPEGDKIVFGVQKADVRTGYLINIHNGQLQKLKIEGFSFPEFPAKKNTLFYQQRHEKYQLSAFDLSESIASSPFPVLLSDFSHRNPDYSEANQKLVYVSNESGQYELWTADSDGKNRQQITRLNKTLRYPRWSNDGKKIAFLAPDEELIGDSIFILEVSSKKLSKLNTGFKYHNRPTWGIKGDKIITAIYQDDFTDLYEFDVETGEARRLTTDGGRFGVEYAENKMFYTRAVSGLWHKELSRIENDSKLIIPAEEFQLRYTWAYTPKGIYYRRNQQNYQLIKFFDIENKTTHPIFKMPWKSFESYGSLSYISKSNKLVFTQSEQPQADIKQLEHPLF